LNVEGAAARWNHREDTDYFSQARDLFRMMTKAQQQTLFENTARAIKGASAAVVQRHISNCSKADPAYGNGVADAIDQLG
jgi:catalase